MHCMINKNFTYRAAQNIILFFIWIFIIIDIIMFFNAFSILQFVYLDNLFDFYPAKFNYSILTMFKVLHNTCLTYYLTFLFKLK